MVAGQARDFEVRLDQVPLLERLEPVGGERERGVGLPGEARAKLALKLL